MRRLILHSTKNTLNKKPEQLTPAYKYQHILRFNLRWFPFRGRRGLLIIQHQRHHQHQQFFAIALLGWFNNTGFCGGT